MVSFFFVQNTREKAKSRHFLFSMQAVQAAVDKSKILQFPFLLKNVVLAFRVYVVGMLIIFLVLAQARFQSCNHIACYDCVRIALHVEFWVGSVPANVLYSAVYSAARVRKSALSELFFSVLQAVKTNLSITNAPRAVCPVCCAPLDWSSIKPYIVLAEEAKYCPVLTLAFAGKDIPPNTPSRHISRTVPPMPLGARCLSAADAEPPDMFTRQQMDQFLTEKDDKRRIESEVDKEVEAQKRLEKAKDIVALFFPKGVDMDLLVSETHYAQTSPGKCVTLLFGLKRLGASQTYIDPFEQWRKQFLHS